MVTWSILVLVAAVCENGQPSLGVRMLGKRAIPYPQYPKQDEAKHESDSIIVNIK